MMIEKRERMSHVFCAGLLWGILLIVPIDRLHAQSYSPMSTESSYQSGELDAQYKRRDHPWWVNLGAGPAMVSSSFVMNAGMVYCYQFDRSMISGRILGMTNNNPTIQNIDPSTVIYKMTDYGILYGPLWHTAHGYCSLGAGIGLVRAGYETPSSIWTNTSISIPFDAQWFWRFTSYAGIGLETYATLNFEKPFYGILVCAQLGSW
jgi:hypothetical protein